MSVDSDDGDGEGMDVLQRHRQAAFHAWGQEVPKTWWVLQDGMREQEGSPSKSVDGPPRKIRQRGSWGASDAGPQHMDATAGDETGRIHDVLRGCRRVVVIGLLAWASDGSSREGEMISTVLGEVRRC